MRLSQLTVALLLLTASALALAQPRAWRDLTFGMSGTEVTAHLGSYEDVRISGVVGLTREITFSGANFRISFLWPDDVLGRVAFTSDPVTASLFDSTFRARQQILVDIISTAYGEPSRVTTPDVLSVQPGFTWTHTWPVDENGVLRRVGIDMWEYRYSAVLWVEDAPRVDAWEAERQRARDADVEDAADDF